MRYLLTIRRFLRYHPILAVVFGGAVFVLSAAAAVIFRFAYFYSSFVIGLFLFFDALAHLLDKSISFTSNLERVGRTFWMVIGGFVILTDLIGGQIVFSVWKYPPYRSLLNWILLYLIIYPVGGLSLIAMYRFFELVFGKILPGQFFPRQKAAIWSKRFLKLIFLMLPVAILGPIILYLFGLLSGIYQQWGLYFLLFLFLFFEWTFFFDVLIQAYSGKPLVYDILTGNKKVILAILVTGLLGAVLHEVINTYVHEWVYLADKFPVTNALFAGVPQMVFVAWIPLSVVCIQAYRLATVIKDRNFFRVLKKAYL